MRFRQTTQPDRFRLGVVGRRAARQTVARGGKVARQRILLGCIDWRSGRFRRDVQIGIAPVLRTPGPLTTSGAVRGAGCGIGAGVVIAADGAASSRLMLIHPPRASDSAAAEAINPVARKNPP